MSIKICPVSDFLFGFGWKTLAWNFRNYLFSAAPVFQFREEVYSLFLSFSKDNKNHFPSSFLPSSCSFQNKKWLQEPEELLHF